MKAKNLLDGRSFEVRKSDRYTNRILETCKYWFEDGNWTILLSPIFDEPDRYHRYSCYMINGQLYESTLTNPYEQLVNLSPRIYQETLF